MKEITSVFLAGVEGAALVGLVLNGRDTETEKDFVMRLMMTPELALDLRRQLALFRL